MFTTIQHITTVTSSSFSVSIEFKDMDGKPWAVQAAGQPFVYFAFNAKELDEETGIYYYEARYMAPPTFISRDPLFEKYFWMSPYAYCANNPVKYVDPTGCTIKVSHWISDGNQGGEYQSGHLNNQTAEQLENFAKTKEGYAFLSKYAIKGQKIGSVEFTENGIYAKHDLNILEFDTYGAPAGQSSYNQGKNNMQFYIHINSAYMNNDFGKESYAITLGHEMFLHMDRIDDKLIKAFSSGCKTDYYKVIEADASNRNSRGNVDHKDYINGMYGKRFISYVSQLITILNAANVDKAKRAHDSKYFYLRSQPLKSPFFPFHGYSRYPFHRRHNQ